MNKSTRNLYSFILAISVIIFNSCGFNEKDNYEIPDLKAIANFSKYSGIGIIDLHSSVESRAVLSENGYKLIGTYEDSEENITDYEVVDFLSNNGTSKQNFFIKNYRPVGDRFIFLQFTKNQNDFYMNWGMYSDESTPIFLLDKTSGKVYKIPPKIGFSFCDSYFDIIYDTIYFVMNYGSEPSIYKMQIQDSQLIVEEIISEPTVTGYYPMIVADVYKNLFVTGAYIITPDRRLIKTDKEETYFVYRKNIDGKIWTEEQEYDETTGEYLSSNFYYYNEEGKLTISNTHPTNFLSFSYFKRDEFDHLIYKDNLDYYYFGNGSIIADSGDCKPYIRSAEIIKLSYTSQDKTDCFREVYSMEATGENPIIINDRIYMMNQNEVFYITITDGKKHIIASGDYILKSISTDGLGNIYFKGLDYNMRNISGIIRTDGSIKTDITPSEHTVIYIAPLN